MQSQVKHLLIVVWGESMRVEEGGGLQGGHELAGNPLCFLIGLILIESDEKREVSLVWFISRR